MAHAAAWDLELQEEVDTAARDARWELAAGVASADKELEAAAEAWRVSAEQLHAYGVLLEARADVSVWLEEEEEALAMIQSLLCAGCAAAEAPCPWFAALIAADPPAHSVGFRLREGVAKDACTLTGPCLPESTCFVGDSAEAVGHNTLLLSVVDTAGEPVEGIEEEDVTVAATGAVATVSHCNLRLATIGRCTAVAFSLPLPTRVTLTISVFGTPVTTSPLCFEVCFPV